MQNYNHFFTRPNLERVFCTLKGNLVCVGIRITKKITLNPITNVCFEEIIVLKNYSITIILTSVTH